MNNPFQLTRAADLDDEQILKLWVDPSGNFGSRLRPSSPLPMIILGGRGSGKTHLLRYYSYQIQRKLYPPDKMYSIVKSNGYIGIHSRCMGLNASRFRGKNLSQEQWRVLFSYYLDLWLGQMMLHTTISFLEDSGLFANIDEEQIVQRLCNLFDRPPILAEYTFSDFNQALRNYQRDVDHAVNNASFRPPAIPAIDISPGNLIFGIPKALADSIPEIRGIMFTLFIDEYEHLYVDQQKHFNTLIRERENPVSFKVGARPHGLKTHKTWGGDEELRLGSDYELLNLDAELRTDEEAYADFAKRLCISRVSFSLGGRLPEGWTEGNAIDQFTACFVKPPLAESFIRDRLQCRESEAPWISQLESSLSKYERDVSTLGIDNETVRKSLIEKLRFPQNPLVEKTSCYLFYQSWSKRKSLPDASAEIEKSGILYDQNSKAKNLHSRKLSHFRKDLIAQMLVDLDLRDFAMNDYIGLPSWIKMSHGIARNLITILKNVFDWSIWKQEELFASGSISIASQVKGVADSSHWFLGDAKVLGDEVGLVSLAMKRICLLLKELRFAEKIPECSLSTFTVDLDSADPHSVKVIETAEQWSLLIKTTDRKDRNTGAHIVSYQINGMIAPDYLLPVASRGDIHLSDSDVHSIFGVRDDEEFFTMLKGRLARCRPPFAKGKSSADQTEENSGDELRLF